MRIISNGDNRANIKADGKVASTSLKDRAFALARAKFPTTKPLTQPVVVGGVTFRPFPWGEEHPWMRYVSLLNSPGLKPQYTLLGKHVEKTWRQTATKLLKLVKEKSPEIYEYEASELMAEDEVRGMYIPQMYLARMIMQQKQFYPDVPNFPEWAMKVIPKFKPLKLPKKEYINEPHANTGFPELTQLAERGHGIRDDVWTKLVIGAANWRRLAQAQSHPTVISMRGITPLTAGFWRRQSKGRPLRAVSKHVGLNEMLIAQPCQAAMESEDWYAYGDREQRFIQMKAVLDGEIPHIEDGDDFGIKVGDAFMSGDVSGFDTSVRWNQILQWTQAVNKHLDDEYQKLYYRTNFAAVVVPTATGVGLCELSDMQGLASGKYDTHSAGSWVENASVEWARKGADNVTSFVDRMNAVGRECHAQKQHLNKHSFEVAKLICTGKTLYGLVLRGWYGLVMYEDPPSGYAGPEDDDARVAQICANTWAPEGNHPCWEDLIKEVKSIWTIRTSKKKLTQRAYDVISKRRNKDSDSPEKWERLAVSATIDALS